MRLGGYGKLTLQDFPGRVAAICFTEGCQLRCPYCHNAQLVLNHKQNICFDDGLTSEFLSYLDQRSAQLDGVVVSGGEPLQQHALHVFLHRIQELGLEVKLDTNGLMPERLKDLIDRGLVDYIAIDYKNCRENYSETVGLSEPEQETNAEVYYDNWWQSLTYLRKNQVPYEIRTTVVRELHPLDALRRMAESIGDEKNNQENWFLQPFVKSGPIMNDLLEKETNFSAYSAKEMEEIRRILLCHVPGVQLR